MFRIEPFQPKYESAWDRFVLEESVNGTFLQTRNFLNYHPSDRFKDCSLVIMNSNTISAVIPACEVAEYEKKSFISHAGSAYGGPVIGKSFYNAAFVKDLIVELDSFWHKHKYKKTVLKLTSNLLSDEPLDLLEYFLKNYSFEDYKDLNTYIDLQTYNEPIISNFNENKMRIIKHINPEYKFRAILDDNGCADFYRLLCVNLEKYNTNPVHSLSEILEFKNTRLKDDVKFYGVFLEDLQLAGVMVFDFYMQKMAHTQYLASDPANKQLNAMTFLYYSLIKHYKERGYRYLSWGISTEEQGKKLNFSLIKNKESYGSEYSVNRTFYKYY